MDNLEKLCLTQAITEAEIYAVKVIEEELDRKGVETKMPERQIILKNMADALVLHREEVRDMYKRSRLHLRDWIMQVSGIGDLAAFRRMGKLGLIGDAVHDMKILEDIQ